MATQIQVFTFNPFMENTYVVYDDSKECVIIDPGCYERSEQLALQNFIAQNGLQVKHLLNTHCHIDHVLGNAFVMHQFGVPLAIHEIEKAQLKAVESYAPSYGFAQYQPSEASLWLKEGDVVRFGTTELRVMFTPGHAAGHVVFVCDAAGFVINGDVLFQGSIGRTDLPGGDFNTLIHSIQQKMFLLPDETVVYCGHGPSTTIGYEKRTNPFCAVGG